MSSMTRDQYQAAEFSALYTDKSCFLCGEDLFEGRFSTGGIVFWSGHGKNVCLHQACAEDLGVQLIQDARSLSRKVKKCAKLTHETPVARNYSESV